MLNRVPPGAVGGLLRRLHVSPAFGVRVGGLALAYGGMPFFGVWRQEGALLARFENSFFLCGEASDFEEIAAFLQFNPYFGRLLGESGAVRRVAGALELPFFIKTYALMACRTGEPAAEPEVLRVGTEGLREVYAVLESVRGGEFEAPPFDAWYPDMSHRIRHGCGRAYLLRREGAPASACLVSAEYAAAGLLSGIATRPENARRGFATAVLARARADLLRDGKLPVLECLPALRRFYELRGFEPVGEMAELCVEGRE